MDESRHNPRPGFQLKLDADTLRCGDFVLYCRWCEWVGEKNAAHAHSNICPECSERGVRIWGHTPTTEGRACDS